MSDQSNHNPNLPPPYYFEGDAISITDILLTLARQIKIILITPTILCSLAIIYVLFIAEPVYISSAKIMSSSGGRISKVSGLASQFGISLPAGQTEPNWVYEDIIKSRTLARTMLNRKFDTNKFGSQKSLLQILTYGNEEPEAGLDKLMIRAVKILLGMIEVSENIKTGIYTVSLITFEPQLASDLTSALIEELDRHQREYNKAKTGEARQFIEERIFEIKKELEIAEETLKDFAKSNRRIDNSPLLLLEQQRLAREVSVLTGVFTTLKQQLETTKIEEVKESDYVIVIDPPEAPLFRSKPQKKKIVIIAGFLGIFLGILIGVIKEYAKNSDDENKEKLSKALMLFRKNILDLIPRKFNN